MTVFLTALFCLLPTLIQGHSLWSLKQSAAGGETLTTGWHFIIELTQINTPHTHSAPDHPCPIFLKPDPDKYSSCKLQGAKVQPPHCLCETAVQSPHKQIIHGNYILSIYSTVRNILKSENSLGGKQPLASPQAKSPPVCVCVFCGYPRLTVMLPQVSKRSELKDPNGNFCMKKKAMTA